MIDPTLKESCDSWLLDRQQRHREINSGLDSGKYEWCDGGCKEQVANCRCEEIRLQDGRAEAWGGFNKALWLSEGVAEARKEVEAMGFSESRIEKSIKQIASWKLQDESDKRTEWFQDG